MKDMIEVTGAKVIDLVKRAYELSEPLGLGHLHYKNEPLSDEDAQNIIDNRYVFKGDGSSRISMDYVNGRSVKFSILEKDGKRFIDDTWYDHTPEQLNELLVAVGVSINTSPALTKQD